MAGFDETLPSRMLIGRDRLFYSGLLGNAMKTRRLGAVAVYVATGGHLEVSVDGGQWQERRIVAAVVDRKALAGRMHGGRPCCRTTECRDEVRECFT